MLMIVAVCSALVSVNVRAQISAEQYITIGDNAQRQGEMDIAEDAYKRAIHAYGQIGDVDNQTFVMEKLKGLLVYQQRWSEVLPYAMEICDLKSAYLHYSLEEKLFDYGMIAVILGNMQKEADAISVLELVETVAGMLDTPFSMGYFHMTSGLVYSKLDKWNEAADCYRKAYDEFSGSDEPECTQLVGRALPLSAIAYYNAGELDESYEAYKKVSARRMEQYGKKSREYADAVCWLANIEGFKGLLDQARKHYMESWDILKQIVSQDLSLLPSNARGAYWKNVNDVMWRMVPFALAAGSNGDPFTSAAYESLVFSKGLLLSTERSTRNVVENTGDRSLLADYMEIAGLRNRIAELQASGDGAGATAVYAEMDSLDIAFTRKLASRGLFAAVPLISTADITSGLDSGEAIVDFADFEKIDGTHIYAAFILKPGPRHPELIRVFEQSGLDSLLAENNGKYSDLYNACNQERMYGTVWEPLMNRLEGVRTLYFVPSGILNQIAVEAIQLPDGTFIGDKYEIVRLSNAKEILTFKNNRTISGFATARLYGGLKYDVSPDTMAMAAEEYEVPPLLALRGKNDMSGAPAGFGKLRMSADEVIEIEDILSHKNINVTKLMGTHGTEESFVSMSGTSPDLLLVSTHGFYYSPENVPSWSSLNGYDNPMYLTGLVMSGGNAEYLDREVPEGVMGGLLTSSDISCLDLSGTQLAVLSACDTGLGETTNEGVYGLQRAFKKAGTGTLVLSLWPVSDMATKEFMVMFHRELAGNGWNKRKAFRQAQKSLRQKYENPYYWAAFIMID